MQNKTDQELYRLVVKKHRPALEEIYNRYVKLVYSFAMKSLYHNQQAAKDIVQLVFTRLWTTQAEFDLRKGNFISWLITITRNITIDYLRKERKQQAREVALTEQYAFEERSFIEPEHYTLQKEMMMEAYQYLNEPQQKLIELIYWQGYTLREIAEIQNEPLGTIKSRLHQSLKILRKHFASGWRCEDYE